MALVSFPVFFAGVAVLLVGLYKYIVYPALLSPLAKIPAARWHARFCPSWSYYIKYANIENKTVCRLHNKYGPIVRMGPAELSVNCYEGGLKTIYTGGFPKTDFYANRFSNYGIEPMFAMIDSKEHSQRKRMLSNIYAKSVVLASPTLKVASHTILFNRLLPILENSADSQTPIDVHKLHYAYSIDSFTAYQFGLKLSSNLIQDVAKREWYLHHFFSPRRWVFWDTELPKLKDRLLKLGIRLVPKWCEESTKLLEDWNLDLCDGAEKLLSEQPNVSASDSDWPNVYATALDKFKQLEKKPGYAVKDGRLEVASEMYDHNAAALETSGDTLTHVHYELARRPALQRRLREELMKLDPPILILSAKPEKQYELPDFKSIDSLPLLDAVLHETLRLWPSVPGGQPRQTPPGAPSTLAGYDNIPPGVRVQSAAYTLHRNPDVFPEPEEWKPERWLDATPEKMTEMRRWFWAFGSGGRMCIGLHIAMHSMKLAIAGTYSNFTTTLIDVDGIEQAMEQDEGFMAGPRGNKLRLQFLHV